MEKPHGIISLGAKMGEGWLLTAEMIELVQGGYGNIVCAQPFGCLPNHIVGKGMVNKIRALYPSANITPIDYDPSATRVNQENRIKLMLAVAKERLNAPAQAAPDGRRDRRWGSPGRDYGIILSKQQHSPSGRTVCRTAPPEGECFCLSRRDTAARTPQPGWPWRTRSPARRRSPVSGGAAPAPRSRCPRR